MEMIVHMKMRNVQTQLQSSVREHAHAHEYNMWTMYHRYIHTCIRRTTLMVTITVGLAQAHPNNVMSQLFLFLITEKITVSIFGLNTTVL